MPFSFDTRTRTWRGPDGRFISWGRVRNVMYETQASAENEVRALGIQLQLREITLEEFERQLRRMVKDAHVASMAIARGGWRAIGPADRSRLGGLIQYEYSRISRMIEQIRSGQQRLDGTLLRRLILYMRAPRKTYLQGMQQNMLESGYTEERSELRAREHCNLCVSQAAIGWQPIGRMVPIGDRECGRNCRCVVYYRNPSTGKILGPF